MKPERPVYLSGETVRTLLKRFKKSGAVGLSATRVMAYIPDKQIQFELFELYKLLADMETCSTARDCRHLLKELILKDK